MKMCRSCVTAFDGKYLQQCSFCGHPAHEGNLCGVGVIRFVPMNVNQHPNWSYLQIQFGRSVGCLCKEERYN